MRNSGNYAWWLVVGMFFVLTVSSGFGFYNLSVYMNALAERGDIAVADVSGATGFLFIVSGVTGMWIGRLIELHDVRWVMVGGAGIGAIALSLLGSATETWQVWALYGLFGIGNSGVSLIPGTTIVTRWFPGANRSVALSVASTGLSAGGVLVTPLCAFAIRDVGMEVALPWFGAVYLAVIVPIAVLVVRSWPEGPRAVSPTRSHGRWFDPQVMKSRFFVGTVTAYVLIMAAQVGGIAHLVNHVDGIAGFVVASSSVSALALASIVGRLLGGLIVMRFPIRAFTLINIAGQGLGLCLLVWASGRTSALVGACVFGVTVGNLLMLQPLLLVQAFGVARYPRVFASANAVTTLGVAGGPIVMGLLYEAFSYAVSFGAAAAASALALAVFAAAGALPGADSNAEDEPRSNTFKRTPEEVT